VSKRVLAISSGGGHWEQMLRLRPVLEMQDVAFATVSREYQSQVQGKRFYIFRDATRWSRFGLIVQAVQIAWILIRERPNIVISTGASSGYFAIRFAKMLRKRTIWIDSIANVEKLSMSGEQVGPYADLWLTQWTHLARPQGPQFMGSVL